MNAQQTPPPPPPPQEPPSIPLPPLKTSWRSIPPKLHDVDDDKIVALIQLLREECQTRSPEEMHLLLNPAEIGEAAEAQFARKGRLMMALRNIFLFLPLMVTWLSFSFASALFVKSASDPKLPPNQSFFTLWVNGFPNLTSYLLQLGPLHIPIPLLVNHIHLFSFGGVAFTDFLLLLCVAIFNQRANVIETNAHKDGIELSKWLREEVKQLAEQSLVRSIGTGPDSKQPAWAIQVHTAINHLLTVLTGVEQAVKVSQESFGNTITRFSDTYQQQNMSVDNLIRNTQDIEIAITQLNTVWQSSKDGVERLEGVLSKMEVQFDKMAEQQKLSTQALLAISTSVVESANAVVALARPFQAVGQGGLARMAQMAADQQLANLKTLSEMEYRLRQVPVNNSPGRITSFFDRIFRFVKGA